MALSLAKLGDKLRQARENARITQDAAAEKLGVPRTALVHIEAGNRPVSTLELYELALLYHRPIADFFREGDSIEADEDVLVTLYRRVPGMESDDLIKEDIAKCVRICREGADLQSLLGYSLRNVPPTYKMDPPRSTLEAVEQGVQTAEQERKRLDLGHAPIPDMADLICGQGIWASGRMLPKAVSGFFVKHPSIGMAILVNLNEPRVRKRFSYAHEYAHALLDRDEWIRVTTSENRHEFVEVRANAFAAAFLMPAPGVSALINAFGKGYPTREVQPVYDLSAEEQHVPAIEVKRRMSAGSQKITSQDVAKLADHFRVSYQAAAYQLKNLKYINKAECDSLLEQEETGRRYLEAWDILQEDLKTPSPPDRCLDQEVAYLALEALRQEEISKGKCNEIIGLLEIPNKTAFTEMAQALESF